MSKVKFIDKSEYIDCWHCNATGWHTATEKCRMCDGSGKWKEPYYHLIAEMPNGQKIAFGVDFVK